MQGDVHPQTASAGSEHYLVLAADIVSSMRLDPADRQALQVDLTDLVLRLNERYGERLGTEFVVTAGDSFQAVIDDPTVVPDVAWDAWSKLRDRVRLGLGFGQIFTQRDPDSRLMDGPAFHNAVKYQPRERISFRGFGELQDAILNGLGGLLRQAFMDFTDRQREILALLRSGHTQQDAARLLGVTSQSVSHTAAAAGWTSYRQGERALGEALRLFVARRGSDCR